MPNPSNEVAVPDNVTVLGAGLMGHGIAQVFATAGSRVRVWDPSAAALASLHQRVRENIELLVSHGVTLPTASDDIIDRIEAHDDLASAVAAAGLIFEAAPESLELKRRLLADVDRLNDQAVVASNTSVLRINDIAAGNPGARRLIGTHWWNPPYLIPIVEVIPGTETAPAITAAVIGWLEAVGKTAILVRKDVPGFIGNRLQFALWREAMQLVEDGVCDAQSVDTVARNTFGLRLSSMGPIENADFIGLDLVQAIMNYVLPDLAINGGAPVLVDDAVAEGRLGAKAGEGILSWHSGARSEAQERLVAGILRSLTAGEPIG